MKTDLYFDFIVDQQSHIITVKREFAADLSLVWDAWTKAEYLDQWWVAEGWKGHTINMEFKEGGHRHYRMNGPEGAINHGLTTYDQIQQHRQFTGRELFVDAEANVLKDYPYSHYQVEFEDQSTTTLVVHVSKYPDQQQFESAIKYGYKEGCENAYALLDTLISKL